MRLPNTSEYTDAGTENLQNMACRSLPLPPSVNHPFAPINVSIRGGGVCVCVLRVCEAVVRAVAALSSSFVIGRSAAHENGA